uniref:Uncharacterized protein n=1 Tax=Setaria italica TaxID=4555 RepID=K3ZBQ4_SETIT
MNSVAKTEYLIFPNAMSICFGVCYMSNRCSSTPDYITISIPTSPKLRYHITPAMRK